MDQEWLCWAPGHGPLPQRIVHVRERVQDAQYRLRGATEVDWVSLAADRYRTRLRVEGDRLQQLEARLYDLEATVRHHVASVELARSAYVGPLGGADVAALLRLPRWRSTHGAVR